MKKTTGFALMMLTIVSASAQNKDGVAYKIGFSAGYFARFALPYALVIGVGYFVYQYFKRRKAQR